MGSHFQVISKSSFFSSPAVRAARLCLNHGYIGVLLFGIKVTIVLKGFLKTRQSETAPSQTRKMRCLRENA